ncbi:hypothetical protein JCM10908_002926 [Rhodotorula pacifica]|uniref:uncharacterized protein n=1 Tax=Rhodotorula pacifica TaxID=1495444 RepID=UPI003181C697
MARQAAAKARDRIAAAASAQDQVNENSDDDEVEEVAASSEREDDEETEPQPVTKTQTRRSSARRTSRGTLSGLLRLPAELITNICEHVDLGTLFHLSRLNKYLWRLLRQTSSLEYLWERAREQSRLPALAAVGMNNYQYANLVFGLCQGCGRSTPKVDYVLRVRYCTSCAESAFWDSSEGWYDDNISYAGLAPANYYNAKGGYSDHTKYLIADIDHILWHIDYMDDGDPGSRTKTEKEFKLRCENADGLALIEWQLERSEERKIELEQIRQRRRAAIEARFVEIGWHPHHFKESWWAEHSLLKAAREFSENVWRSVEGPLTKQLELRRDSANAHFLSSERVRRMEEIKTEYNELSINDARQLGLNPSPRWADFASLPSVRALYEITDVDQAYAEPKPSIRGHIDDIVDDIGAAVDQLEERMHHALRKVLRVQQRDHPSLLLALYPDDEDGNEQLELAVALFRCAIVPCRFVDTFPRILSHRCNGYGTSGKAPLSEHAYAPADKAIIGALTLLAVNAMPVDTKSEQMDELGSTWTCLKHEHARPACTWLELLEHIERSDCEASDVISETLEDAKERVFA